MDKNKHESEVLRLRAFSRFESVPIRAIRALGILGLIRVHSRPFVVQLLRFG